MKQNITQKLSLLGLVVVLVGASFALAGCPAKDEGGEKPAVKTGESKTEGTVDSKPKGNEESK